MVMLPSWTSWWALQISFRLFMWTNYKEKQSKSRYSYFINKVFQSKVNHRLPQVNNFKISMVGTGLGSRPMWVGGWDQGALWRQGAAGAGAGGQSEKVRKCLGGALSEQVGRGVQWSHGDLHFCEQTDLDTQLKILLSWWAVTISKHNKQIFVCVTVHLHWLKPGPEPGLGPGRVDCVILYRTWTSVGPGFG